MILIADIFERFEPFIEPVSPQQLETGPGDLAGTGHLAFSQERIMFRTGWPEVHETIALRVTAHPVCRDLVCRIWWRHRIDQRKYPAGRASQECAGRRGYFGSALCGIVAGDLGGENKPSEIRDLVTGRMLREG